MPLQRIEQGRQEGNQTFATLAIVRVPCLHRRVQDLWSIARLARMPDHRLQNLLTMIQEPVILGIVWLSRTLCE